MSRLSPMQYVIDFVRIWKPEAHYEINATGSFRQEISEYEANLLKELERVMEGAYVSEPCKEFFGDTVRTSIHTGAPPGYLVPLEDLGISLEEERYGIFDPTVDTNVIERRLLEFHDHIMSGVLSGNGGTGLNRRWHQTLEYK